MNVIPAIGRAGWLFVGLIALGAGVQAEKPQSGSRSLEGTWIGATATPLQRPPAFADKATFTPEEAEAFVRGHADRTKAQLPSDNDRLLQIDLDETYAELEHYTLDGLRTSLIVDPPNGMLPPARPSVATRAAAARARRTFDGPETANLAERCLLANPRQGGSMASPPMLPSVALASFYQIVQTDDDVLIFAEWMHDARVVRMNGTHPPASIRRWLGDSIGRWEGATLVVDTTNFRPDTANLNSTDRLHVVERFTRRGAERLHYRVTVEDPDTWDRPWTAEWDFKASTLPLYEVACHEHNTAIEYFLRGARAEERARAGAR